MNRTYNIGSECYALMTSQTDAEFLLPVKVLILDKITRGTNTIYKIKIRDILETNFEYVREHLQGLRVPMSSKSDNLTTLIKKQQLEALSGMGELLNYLNEKPFYIEGNYVVLDKEGLKDLYIKFTKYLISYHYRKLFQLMSRGFIANTPIFENQKDMFYKRVNSIGFGDMFRKMDLKINI